MSGVITAEFHPCPREVAALNNLVNREPLIIGSGLPRALHIDPTHPFEGTLYDPWKGLPTPPTLQEQVSQLTRRVMELERAIGSSEGRLN